MSVCRCACCVLSLYCIVLYYCIGLHGVIVERYPQLQCTVLSFVVLYLLYCSVCNIIWPYAIPYLSLTPRPSLEKRHIDI